MRPSMALDLPAPSTRVVLSLYRLGNQVTDRLVVVRGDRATWAISFLFFVDFEIFFSSSVTAPTAASMPRLSPIGFAPAVTFLSPSR